MKHESIAELETTLKLIQRQPDGFTYRDKLYRHDPAQAAQYGKPFAEAQALTSLLYSEAYARKRSAGNVSLQVPEATPEYLQQQQLFTAQLSAHNHTPARTDAGWMVAAAYPDGQLSVHKQGVSVTIRHGEYELPPGAVQAVANMAVTRIFPKENRTLQPAFYYVYSEAGFDYSPTILRIYWNIEADGAGKLIAAITQRFNHYRVPFLFKCLNHPMLYNRRDAAVLYIQKRYLSMLEEILPAVIAEIKPYLQDDVPLFTYMLAPGVGFAESPVDGDSFGLTRMRMVASGLISALDKQYKQPAQQLSEIITAFAQQGISAEAPYLNDGSAMVLKPMNS